MLGRFNKVFGIQDDLLTEQRRFVERINQTAFANIEQLQYPVSYRVVFETVCYWLSDELADPLQVAMSLRALTERKSIREAIT
jgi:hypothetical protein